MTGCLVALVTCVLHADNRVVVAVPWVVQHNVSHVDVGERMTTSKNGRLRYVHKWTLGSRERAENESMTIKWAEKRVVVRVTWVC